MTDVTANFRRIMKLNTLCVGGLFSDRATVASGGDSFPGNILAQTEDFVFQCVEGCEEALAAANSQGDLDLVFLDADDGLLSALTTFITQLREIRPRLPVVVFSNKVDDVMRQLMKSGAAWHFTKYSDELYQLARYIHQNVFSQKRWEDVFSYYTRDDVKPRIEPGLSLADLEALKSNAEEQYIIKRLFANSDVVQIFRMDEGFSGSRIYTVKPRHQLKRILKIGTADALEAVQDKHERLIQPRLFRQVGQIRGKIISAQHLGGACYSLAGSKQDANTLSQFLLDQNKVRRDLLDRILGQLRESLSELYTGSAETELRYWAPLYASVLPPNLTLKDAQIVANDVESRGFLLDAKDLNSISAVPGNRVLEGVNRSVRNGEQPELVLRGFEVAELDSKNGVLYLHDTLSQQYPADPLLKGREHPILRFKVYLRDSERGILTHPVLRRGKQIALKGRAFETQEMVLARNVSQASGEAYDFDADSYEVAKARFIPLLKNIEYLLWEVGREDMISPPPTVSAVVHGDLNAGNILVETSTDMPLWLIDFSHARAGHVYFDLAKLEVEVRTHVFFKLLQEMVEERIWDEATAEQFVLLVENALVRNSEGSFKDFASFLRDCQSEWYDTLYAQFPLYFENLLYFIFALRQIARLISPERFAAHYPVAVFFQSVAALKYEGLNEKPWHPWSKRLALACALVHGKAAVDPTKQSKEIETLLSGLRQRSALALIAVGEGENRKYLMQWNDNWDRFHLVGGRVKNERGDRDSFARALQRKLGEELGLDSPKDYRIKREFSPIVRQQFSRRQHIFKEYEFRVFEIELLPRHPRSEEEFTRFAHRITADRENLLLTRAEIMQLRTVRGRPISETARILLEEIGEIARKQRRDQSTMLDLELDDARPMVRRGRVCVTGALRNARFGNLMENALVEVLPRPGYAVEHNSSAFNISALDAGQEFPFELWLQPREEDAKLTLRVTYYDTRGNEYRQIVERPIQFRSPAFSLFHLDNPYVIGKPINSGNDSLYMGRKEVFNWIGSNLFAKERPGSLILTGQRRMGKTSTLFQLLNGTVGRTLRDYPEHPVIAIYFNLDDLRAATTGGFFSSLSEAIARNLRVRGIDVPAPNSWPVNGHGYRLFDQYLDQIETSLPDESLLVLIMDELDGLRTSIEQGELDHDILPYLRSLMQHRSRLSFIISGSNELKDEFWQLVFNAAESLELTALSRRETERLIREPVQPLVRYDDLAVEHIWRATSGHPYLTQLICYRLIQEENKQESGEKIITIDQVQRVIEQVVEEDDSFLIKNWEELSKTEQQVLVSLAELQGPGEEMIPFEALVPPENGELLQKALEGLVAKGLVTSIGGDEHTSDERDRRFMLAYGLLRHWLLGKEARRKPVRGALSLQEAAVL